MNKERLLDAADWAEKEDTHDEATSIFHRIISFKKVEKKLNL
jgi:hypothetical protein